MKQKDCPEAPNASYPQNSIGNMEEILYHSEHCVCHGSGMVDDEPDDLYDDDDDIDPVIWERIERWMDAGLKGYEALKKENEQLRLELGQLESNMKAIRIAALAIKESL